MKMNKIKKERLSGAEIYSKYGMFIILVVIVIAAALLSKNFLKIANITNVFRQTSVVSIIAFGQTMILILGMIDLSQGSVMALTGCIACSVAASNNTSPSFVVLALFGRYTDWSCLWFCQWLCYFNIQDTAFYHDIGDDEDRERYCIAVYERFTCSQYG